MTPAVLDGPCSARLGDRGERARRRRVTLEERLDAGPALRANGSTECPVCHARMTPRAAGADCGGCGSRLS